MTWAAFNAGEIHLDHRTPLSKFDCTTEAGIRAAWALTNLQPLWATDNQRKYTTVLPPLPAALGLSSVENKARAVWPRAPSPAKQPKRLPQ